MLLSVAARPPHQAGSCTRQEGREITWFPAGSSPLGLSDHGAERVQGRGSHLLQRAVTRTLGVETRGPSSGSGRTMGIGLAPTGSLGQSHTWSYSAWYTKALEMCFFAAFGRRGLAPAPHGSAVEKELWSVYCKRQPPPHGRGRSAKHGDWRSCTFASKVAVLERGGAHIPKHGMSCPELRSGASQTLWHA